MEFKYTCPFTSVVLEKVITEPQVNNRLFEGVLSYIL